MSRVLDPILSFAETVKTLHVMQRAVFVVRPDKPDRAAAPVDAALFGVKCAGAALGVLCGDHVVLRVAAAAQRMHNAIVNIMMDVRESSSFITRCREEHGKVFRF